MTLQERGTFVLAKVLRWSQGGCLHGPVASGEEGVCVRGLLWGGCVCVRGLPWEEGCLCEGSSGEEGCV